MPPVASAWPPAQYAPGPAGHDPADGLVDHLGLSQEDGFDLPSDESQAIPEVGTRGRQVLAVGAVEVAVAAVEELAGEGDQGERGVEFLSDAVLGPCMEVPDHGLDIKELQRHRMRFILGAKRGEHGALFEEIESKTRTRELARKDRDGVLHEFRYLEGVALNKSHPDLKVNVLNYWAMKPNGNRQHFSWATDLPVNPDTVMRIMRAGRARWRVENETFNT